MGESFSKKQKNKKIRVKKPVKNNVIRERGKRKCSQTHGLHKRYFEFFIYEEGLRVRYLDLSGKI